MHRNNYSQQLNIPKLLSHQLAWECRRSPTTATHNTTDQLVHNFTPYVPNTRITRPPWIEKLNEINDCLIFHRRFHSRLRLVNKQIAPESWPKAGTKVEGFRHSATVNRLIDIFIGCRRLGCVWKARDVRRAFVWVSEGDFCPSLVAGSCSRIIIMLLVGCRVTWAGLA